MVNYIYFGDNLEILKGISDKSIPLIYIDPPFNSRKQQSRTQIRTVQDPDGDRRGFKGSSYRTEEIGTRKYADIFDDYEGFIRPRMEEAYRILAPNGSLYFHIDYQKYIIAKYGQTKFLDAIVL